MRVTILGGGSMGTALALVAAARGHQVFIWNKESEVVKEINNNHTNERYLPGIKLSPAISASTDLAVSLKNSTCVLVVVPSHVVREVLIKAKKGISKKAIVINAAKGIEEKTGKRMSEVIEETLSTPHSTIATLSGPSIAREIAEGIPTAVTVATSSRATINIVRKALETDNFKIEASADMVGVETCGTMKNVYAIAAGMCDALKYSMNAKAFLLTLALSEIKTMVKHLGGRPETVFTVAGVGDLIVTALSEHGRNRSLGERICTKDHCHFRLDDHQTDTLEGVVATKVILGLAKKARCELPLAQMVWRVLYQQADPHLEIPKFFQRYHFG